jgi:hypothetical protein
LFFVVTSLIVVAVAVVAVAFVVIKLIASIFYRSVRYNPTLLLDRHADLGLYFKVIGIFE